jgi:hypothetical protein
MASVNAQIRWADNTAELKQRLNEGIGVIDAMKQAVDRTATSMGGQGLFMQANKLTAAIDQLGGATKLTASEQDRATATLDKAIEKYKVMGMTAPPAMLELRDAMKGSADAAGEAHGIFDNFFNSFAAHVAEGMLLRDVLREVMSFAKESITETAKIEDLAKATGMSTDAVQRFAYVGQEFGIESETMARGVEQLSAKLANGDKNATSAVQALGLSVKNLLSEGPKDAFLDVADALGRVEDPMTKAGLATEVFGGRLSKQLLPALGELKQKMDEVPKSALISDENVKKAHDFDVGMQHLETQLKATTVALLGWMAAAAKSAAAPGMEESLTISASADERAPQRRRRARYRAAERRNRARDLERPGHRERVECAPREGPDAALRRPKAADQRPERVGQRRGRDRAEDQSPGRGDSSLRRSTENIEARQ